MVAASGEEEVRHVTAHRPAVLGEMLHYLDPSSGVSNDLYEVVGIPALDQDELATLGSSGYANLLIDLRNCHTHVQAYPHELRRYS